MNKTYESKQNTVEKTETKKNIKNIKLLSVSDMGDTNTLANNKTLEIEYRVVICTVTPFYISICFIIRWRCHHRYRGR